MHAVFGHAAAQYCAVLGSEQQANCGSATELNLVPAGPLAAHRAFLGTEKVHAHVRGVPSLLPVMNRDNALYLYLVMQCLRQLQLYS